jgi:LysM repeat protein
VASSACGDSGGAASPDLDNVPTATLPATLPEAVIVEGGAVQPGGGSSYTIQSGDTLATIAERFSISLDDLLAANPGVNPAQLRSGDLIALPSGIEVPPPAAEVEPTEQADATAEATATPEPASATPEPPATNTPSSLGQTYTVQAGDIPATIAEQFGVSVDALMAANPGVDARNLQIGQVLVIPPAPTPPPPEG